MDYIGDELFLYWLVGARRGPYRQERMELQR